MNLPAKKDGRSICALASTRLACLCFATLLADPCLAGPATVADTETDPRKITGLEILVDNDVEPLGIRLPVGVGDWLRVRVNYAKGAPLYYYHLSREAPMTWTLIPAADGTSVAHIDDEGRLTTLAPGRAQIEVQYLGFKALTLLTVFEEPPAALEISPSHRTIDRGTELQLNATAHFDAAREWDMTERVTWSATDVGSESQVVAIDPSGKVRALGIGMAEITVTLSGSAHRRG